MSNHNNQENIPPVVPPEVPVLPEPPVMTRQVGGYVGDDTMIPFDNEPEVSVHGQSFFSLLDGYDTETYENICRNNGWYVSNGPYEEEDLTDSSDDEEDEEEEVDDEAMINEFVNNF